jgi:1-acyl-sn-glycerol-3-phosphate acyltransferase
MKNFWKPFLFALSIRPIVGVLLGLNVRHRERLPQKGPAIIVANHNSHLDTVALMSLYKGDQLRAVRPVAAVDYWMKGGIKKWIAQNVIDIIPIERKAARHWMDPIKEALNNNSIILLFPEGSRGNPEELAEFKSGVGKISEAFPEVPVYPIFLHGFGKSLPRGEAILVPHFCDIFIGEALKYSGDNDSFVSQIRSNIESLASEGNFPSWE